MITCSTLGTMGRLGNQMFQYATLYAIAKENNYDFGVPYKKQKSSDEFAKFHLPEVFSLSAKDSSSSPPVKQIYREKFHHFDPDIFSIEDNTDIFGYFQTEKYFKKYREEIKKEFTFPKNILSFCNFFKKSLGNKVVSLHVRRGDYLKIPNIHPPCSAEYYEKAIQHFDEDVSFLIFSDDVSWCIENFKEDKFKIFHNNHYYSLCMMSLCDGHIIANSSFSWWGAWLGKVDKVVAPKKWFGQELNHKSVIDVYCDNWIVI